MVTKYRRGQIVKSREHSNNFIRHYLIIEYASDKRKSPWTDEYRVWWVEEGKEVAISMVPNNNYTEEVIYDPTNPI